MQIIQGYQLEAIMQTEAQSRMESPWHCGRGLSLWVTIDNKLGGTMRACPKCRAHSYAYRQHPTYGMLYLCARCKVEGEVIVHSTELLLIKAVPSNIQASSRDFASCKNVTILHICG